MPFFTLLTTYIRSRRSYRYATIAGVCIFAFISIFGFATESEALAPLAIWGIGAAASLLTGALAVNAARDQLLGGIATLMMAIIDVLKGLFLIVIYNIINVSRYTQFIDSIPVTRGWEIIRDLCNMFFVLILLAIAIGTILQHEKYTYSKTLPKLISAAILINFSKTIAGLGIDFANVVMLTFVGAIENVAGGNFVALIGMQDFLSYLKADGPAKLDVAGTFLSLTLTFLFMVIALIVVIVMLFILIARVVALWFLVVLSPAAFFLSALPDDKGFGKKWWDQFVNYLIVGPIMMFFLWLSFTTLQLSGDPKNPNAAPLIGRQISTINQNAPNPFANSGLATSFGSPQHTLGTFLGIVMLLGSMVVAQQLGVEGGKMAGGVVQGARDWAAGKKGPSPMRYFRDRWSAYSKMREQQRQERAKLGASWMMKAAGKAISLPGEATEALIKQPFMASEMGKKIRQWWDTVPLIGTKARDDAAQRRSDEMGRAVEARNEAGVKKQGATNARQRAILAEGGREKLDEEKEAIETQLHTLHDKRGAVESAKEKFDIDQEIEGLELRLKGVDVALSVFDGKEGMKKQSELLKQEATDKRDLLKEENPEEKTAREEGNKFLQDAISEIKKRAEEIDTLTPHDKEQEEEFKREKENLLRDIAAAENQIRPAPEQLSSEQKKRISGEADILEKQAQKLDEYIQEEERTGKKGAATGKLVSDLREEAIDLEIDAEKLEVNAKGHDLNALANLAMMKTPDFAMSAFKGTAAIVLQGLGAPAMLAPFANDLLNASQRFGNNLTLEGQDIELHAVGEQMKHFSHLRDEVVKAIANGTAKGYSKLAQMAAKQEMMRRNLYESSEIPSARRDFVKQGAGGAAVEGFDYEVFKQYPSEAFGMTADKLVELVQKQRIDLSKITRPDSINVDLLKAINRLPTAISAQLNMRMKKSSPLIEEKMKIEADKELRRMRADGTHYMRDEDGNIVRDANGVIRANKDYEALMKVLGTARGFADEHLGINAQGNFTSQLEGAAAEDEIKFNKQIIVNATRDDDVAPYVFLMFRNRVYQNKDSDLAKIAGENFNVQGDNKAMALHVFSALRRNFGNLGDRSSANMNALSRVLKKQLIEIYGSEEEAKKDPIYAIAHWGETRI